MKEKKNNKIKVYHYDPVCRRKLNKNKAYYIYSSDNEEFLLCCPVCQSEFEMDTKNYIKKAKELEKKTSRQRAR